MENNKMPISSVMTRTVICVDNYENSIPKGFVCSQIYEFPLPFCGVIELFKIIDNIMDDLAFPQKSMDYRRFSRYIDEESEHELKLYNDEKSLLTNQGKIATFMVQVLFRQNATWQGNISWLNNKKTQNFRSSLEMLKLMDDAITLIACTDDLSAVNWDPEPDDE